MHHLSSPTDQHSSCPHLSTPPPASGSIPTLELGEPQLSTAEDEEASSTPDIELSPAEEEEASATPDIDFFDVESNSDVDVSDLLFDFPIHYVNVVVLDLNADGS